MSMSFVIGLLLHVVFCAGVDEDANPCSGYAFNHELLESQIRLELSHEATKEELRILKEELKILKSRNPTPTTANQKLRGGNYIQWGRTTCPGNAKIVYKVHGVDDDGAAAVIMEIVRSPWAFCVGVCGDDTGYAGGSWFDHSGAASNYLCLPEQPQWSYNTRNDNTADKYVALVYGAEYERMHVLGDSFQSQDVPCVVCDTARSNILMIPGRITCYDGWNVEYVGYLTAGYYDHTAASEYVCLDSRPEKVTGGTKDENGKLFYPAEAKCGSLKCPPYVNGRVLSCVVCSK